MIKLLIVIALISIFLLYFINFNKKNGDEKKAAFYKNILSIIIIIFLIFIVAVYGKILIPKLFQILKTLLPLLTKFLPL